ncbi:hypothetical protein GLE_5091 [Lysobacter enzymogenes]|uniref:Uncharacterized protein n=1 Tax=Lysobacter enzymogenes TaxID=69 RepID=A0A0S2DPN9_LYSEN|nr:hypothetical protein [Lysobacter enzymogenes]ALN60432.1 hypothetical protein GLE_5091 [Lysobacter enzymogenes]QCW28367.1 hypothetical protein FE772_24670 [Lysobacter enzymogenes]
MLRLAESVGQRDQDDGGVVGERFRRDASGFGSSRSEREASGLKFLPHEPAVVGGPSGPTQLVQFAAI